MNEAELVETLKRYGLSPYQASAYVALVNRGTVAAQDVADVSDVPRPRVYDVVRDLESKGFVTTYEQDKLYVQALDPESALEGVRERADQLERAVAAVTERWQQPTLEQHTTSLVQRAQSVFEKGIEELDHALDYAQVVLSMDRLEPLRETLADAHERDIFVDCTVYGVDNEDDMADIDFGAFCTRAHAIRHPLRSDPFGVLVDRQRACYSWHQRTEDEYGLYVDDSAHENMIWHYTMNLRQAAEEVYVETPYEPPLRFGSLRDCLAVIEPLVRDDADLRAEVTGESVATGRERRETGTIASVSYPGFEAGAPPEPHRVFAEARLTLETGNETYTVGGFDARTEDIEASRVVVTEIDG